MPAIHKLLIANRGEIACRIARTCRRLGIAAAAVHSRADGRARHVRDIGESYLIGEAAPSASYLSIDAIVDAARKAGADAVHPGYGFLSENPAFVRAIEAAGLIFVGPTAETMERLGGKASAKREAAGLGIPTVPGNTNGLGDPQAVIEAVQACGLPALLKAVAGGGGRGMALVESLDRLRSRVESAMREAQQAFGSGEMIVERYLPEARHIEVQIAGDGLGHAIHLFERECSLQRRHQKVIEEAPSAGLPEGLRARILEDARRLAAALRYRGLGTVEFIVCADAYYFLEVNPRLQVEHPVTEEITGLDLVELQLGIAAGLGLPLSQDQVQARGHAFEARVYAEDPDAGFAPCTGPLGRVQFPTDLVRVESGVDSGDEITPYYDPMIAKLIATGGDRRQALERLQAGLEAAQIAGLTTNLAFLRTLLAWDETRSGRMHTRLIDQRWQPGPASHEVPVAYLAAAALCWLREQRQRSDLDFWSRPEMNGWRTASTAAPAPSAQPALILRDGGRDSVREWAVHYAAVGPDGYQALQFRDDTRALSVRARLAPDTGGTQTLELADQLSLSLHVALQGPAFEVLGPLGRRRLEVVLPLAASAAGAVASGELRAPMMGKIVAVLSTDGEPVKSGQSVIVLESMKMEFAVAAERDGVVKNLRCAPGDMVGRGDLLGEISAAPVA